MGRSYEESADEPPRPLSDALVVVIAVVCAVGAAWGAHHRLKIVAGCLLAGCVPAGVIGARRGAVGAGRRWLLVPCFGLLAVWGAGRAADGLHYETRGAIEGAAELVSDPERRYGAVSVVLRVDGKRLQVDAYGGVGRRLERLSAGDRVWVVGRLAALNSRQASRLASRHIVARLDLTLVGDTLDARPITRAANRVRDLLVRGAKPLPVIERSLFLGLVIGDDRAEPADLVADFRRAGLSHLTAVSGQNIGFLLIAFGPLLTRLRPRSRWVATIGLIGWFALLTRFEPSVLRAGAMAMLAATVFWRGWHASPVRLLAVTVTVFTLIDPLIARSIGWWLSVGATAGISLLAGPIAEGLPGPRWFAEPAGASLAAQLGVMPVSLIIFHRLPLLGLGANLLAGAPAGFVMVWGIPAALIGGAIPWIAAVVHFPSLIATRWVLTVARVAAAAEPDVPIWVSGPVHVLLTLFLLKRKQRMNERC